MSKKIIFPLAIFVAGLCSIIYELEISTASSYFLGDSIKQFSLTIGIYMASMGIGSWWSRFFKDPLWASFILVEIALGLIGGLSIPLAYFLFDKLSYTEFQTLMLGMIAIIGVLTGLEIPLLSRIMEGEYDFKDNLANVLSLDYFGALAATLLFPFLLLPGLGVFRTSVFFGLVNILLGFFVAVSSKNFLDKKVRQRLEMLALLPAFIFGVLLFSSKSILKTWENKSFAHEVIFAQQTPYQHLVLTKNRNDVRLYINRIIQFSSMDEYRYHETLALLPAASVPFRTDVLVLGGGEGLLARELLKFQEVKQVTVVDLDTAVFELAGRNPLVRKINADALHDPRVRCVAQDANVFLDTLEQTFDLIIADLPDPSNEAVARLYSTAFFKKCLRSLRPNGIFATQATSPFHTKQAFWCIGETLASAGFEVIRPLHVFIPMFGDWGFWLAARRNFDLKTPPADISTRFLDSNVVQQMTYFQKDLQLEQLPPANTLDHPVLLDLYLSEWQNWSREKLNLSSDEE